MILKHGLRSTSIALVAIVLAQGCAANKTMDVMTDEKITAPKVVAMSGSRGAWVYEIEK